MPTSNLNVELTQELDLFVREAVESGRYESTNEVIRAALRSLEREEHDDDTEAYLRQAIADGMASGVAEGDVIARVRERAGLPPRIG